MKKGYIQVYTGDGKGKTTAALGLVTRALGAGLSVHVIQFIKSMEYSELHTLRKLGVPVHQFGRGCFIRGVPAGEDREIASRGLSFARELMDTDLDLLVLDEINVAIALGLLETEDVLEVLRAKPEGMELICTGRGAPPALVEIADLVTEMVSVRHYYDSGVEARDGIER